LRAAILALDLALLLTLIGGARVCGFFFQSKVEVDLDEDEDEGEGEGEETPSEEPDEAPEHSGLRTVIQTA
jgi:hypothetical protein